MKCSRNSEQNSRNDQEKGGKGGRRRERVKLKGWREDGGSGEDEEEGCTMVQNSLMSQHLIFHVDTTLGVSE